MTTAGAFDGYASNYSQTVNLSVRFVGKDVEFFARTKARLLLGTAERLPCPLSEVRALDVGCGTGLTDSLLLPRVGSLDGVDVSAEMVVQAGSRNPSATYQVYDGGALPYENASFNLVFAACVLHHVAPSRWDQFLAELWRVTAVEGVTVVIEHNPLNPLTRRAVRGCPFDGDAVLVPPRRVRECFRQLGAPTLECRFMTFLPVDTAWARQVEDHLGWLPAGAQFAVKAFRQ
jgi:ubiquinone/menaquinone biosynthesis C-methylase UbiE